MSDASQKFGAYHTGAVMFALQAKVEAQRTKPPTPYTEAELMDDMLSAHKFAETEQLREQLKSVQGIGTSRTRGTFISNHIARDFIRRTKKGKNHQLHITEFGTHLLSQLPPSLKSVSLTARWELALTDLATHILANDAKSEVEMLKLKRGHGEVLKRKISEMVVRLMDEAFASSGKSSIQFQTGKSPTSKM
ncbi:DNA topoisomerase [Variovorax gossypii]|nr:DNA topoisomerase [uncultured Variovorax sp.]